jgi:mRNA interferase RelE/StbE
MSYKLWIDPPALKQIKKLPGNMRQQIRRSIDDLRSDARPSRSNPLEIPDITLELRRIRIESWRVIYGVSETDQWVWILAVHKRPPYNYDDLPELLEKLRELQG